MTLRRLLSAILVLSLAGAAGPALGAEYRTKKKAKKKTGYDYDKSKYKSRDLSEPQGHAYKFNERGEPLRPKKKAPPKKKQSEPPDIEDKTQACGADQSCSSKAEAEAL